MKAIRDCLLGLTFSALTICAFVGVFVVGAYINGWRPY